MKHLKNTLIVILFLLFESNFIFAQNQIIGQIINEKDKTPIYYANIWILGTNYGTSSLENGNFSLMIDSINPNIILKISSIGYYDTSIQFKNFTKKIQLKPKAYEISEIKVFPKKSKEYIINDLNNTKINAAIMQGTTPRIFGLFLPYKSDYNEYQFVKKILIYTRDRNRSKFNLRIYSFDTITKKPIKELITENILVKTKLSILGKPKFVEINLSKYYLKIPKNGLLIGVEWLVIPENRYKVDYHEDNSSEKKSTKFYYGPELAATLATDGSAWEYDKGIWLKSNKHGVLMKESKVEMYYFNPAISVVLTN